MAEATFGRLELPNDNGVFVFTEWSEFKKWAADERSAWAKLSAAQPQCYAAYDGVLSPIATSAQPANQTEQDQNWQKRSRSLVAAYAKLIHSASPKGQLVLSLLSESGPEAAAGAWATFSARPLESLAVPATLRGVHAAIAYERGEPLAASKAAASLDHLYSEARASLESLRSDMTRALATATDTQQSITESTSRHQTDMTNAFERTKVELRSIEQESKRRHDELQTRFEAEAKEAIGKASESLEALERTYNEKLALQAAVNYWSKKRDTHRDLSKLFGGLFAAVLVLGSIAAGVLCYVALPSESAWHTLPISRIAMTAIGVTAIVWLIRVMARLFFVNLHLGTDADERVVMVTTYLALLRESAGLKDDDRALVIERLFRHTATGFVKDDANPPLLLGGLLRKPD